MHVQGASGGLILSLELELEYLFVCCQIIRQAPCLHLGIMEDSKKQRSALKGLITYGWGKAMSQKINQQHID